MKDGEIGIYIHIPFCMKKCLYCDFPSYAGVKWQMAPYLKALLKEMKAARDEIADYNIGSIYIGGGTPTFFKTPYISSIMETCTSLFNIDGAAEVTIEANPGTLNKERLKVLREMGINRLSIGVQAWQTGLLRTLGRIHDSNQVISDIDWAREVGFENISVDLMFGLPNQTFDQWAETLDNVCNLDVEHVSAYSLKVEEGTPLYTMVANGTLELVDEDTERNMYHHGISFLKSKGYIQYEISNFAKEGYRSRHNLRYWKNGEYIGFGCGAHSYLRGMRRYNYPQIEKYIDTIEKRGHAIADSEYVGKDIERFETVMMGLRLMEGVNKREFLERFGNSLDFYYGDVILKLKTDGLLREDDTSICLTMRGMDIQNTVLLAFLDYME